MAGKRGRKADPKSKAGKGVRAGVVDKKAVSEEERREQVARLYCQSYSIPQIAHVVGVRVEVVKDDLVAVTEQWRTQAGQVWGDRVNRELARLDHQYHVVSQAWEASQRGTTRVRRVQARVARPSDPVAPEDKLGESRKGSKGMDILPISGGNGNGSKTRSDKGLAQQGSSGPIGGRQGVDLPQVGGTTWDMVEVERTEEHTSSAGDPRYMSMLINIVELRLKLLGVLSGNMTQVQAEVQLNWDSLIVQQRKDGSQGMIGTNNACSQNGEIIEGVGYGTGGQDIDPVEARLAAIRPVPTVIVEGTGVGGVVPGGRARDPKQAIVTMPVKMVELDDESEGDMVGIVVRPVGDR